MTKLHEFFINLFNYANTVGSMRSQEANKYVTWISPFKKVQGGSFEEGYFCLSDE